MTSDRLIQSGTPPRRLWRSTSAVLLGIFVGAALSLGTDQVLHVLQVYPPWGEPMHDPGLNLLALAYRIPYAVVGCYIAARFAPRNPMRHALAGGVVGLVLSVVGAIAAINVDLGPVWYPIALVVTALPCAWLGGVLHRARHPECEEPDNKIVPDVDFAVPRSTTRQSRGDNPTI